MELKTFSLFQVGRLVVLRSLRSRGCLLDKGKSLLRMLCVRLCNYYIIIFSKVLQIIKWRTYGTYKHFPFWFRA